MLWIKHTLAEDEPRYFHVEQRKTDGRNNFLHIRRHMQKNHLALRKKKKKNSSPFSRKALSLSFFLKSHVNLLLTTRWHLCTAFEMDSSENKSTCGVVRIESEVLLLHRRLPPPPCVKRGVEEKA